MTETPPMEAGLSLDQMYADALGDPLAAKIHVHTLLNQDPGRFLLAWIRQFVNFDLSPHCAGDPYNTAHRIGCQDVARELLRIQAADVETLRTEKARADRRLAAARNPTPLFGRKGVPHDPPESA